MKRQKEIPGSIFSIKIDEKKYSFGRILNGGSAEFYHLLSESEDVNINFLLEQKILFYALVFSHAITNGRWNIIGKTILEDRYKKMPKFFLPDVTDKNHYRIVDTMGFINESTREECKGLDFGIIWEPESIEDRLRDYYNNRENEMYNYYKSNYGIYD